MLTYQFRLYPTKKQAKCLIGQIEQHRMLYNHCLDLKIKSYQETGKSPSCFDLIKSEVTKFKSGCNYSSLQQTIRRLDKSYKAFFSKNSKFPRFKAKGRFRTIEYGKLGDGCKIHPEHIYLQHVGKVYCKFHRNIDCIPKTLSITHRNGRFYVNIIVEIIKPINEPKFDNAVGIDFGIKTTITTSNGDKFVTPKFTKLQEKTVARLNRRKNYKALRKVYTKTQNQRKDFNHKLSRKIVTQYDIICLENLKVEDITSFSNINTRIYDIAINQLINFITYKAENAGKYVVMVNPAYTTQTCSQCGAVKPKSLTDRIHSCDCGFTCCRDKNSAINILRLGLESLVTL